jgi:hypothetical protein
MTVAMAPRSTLEPLKPESCSGNKPPANGNYGIGLASDTRSMARPLSSLFLRMPRRFVGHRDDLFSVDHVDSVVLKPPEGRLWWI